MSKEKSGVERRKFLKASGASFGLAGVGIIPNISKAIENGTSLGEVTFAEMSVGHENVPSFPVAHTDDFAEYLVGNERDQVVLTKAADDETVGTFRNSDAVATDMNGLYQRFSNARFNDDRSEFARLDPTRELQLTKPYRSPPIKLNENSAGTVEVVAGGASISVKPNGTEQLTLSPREVVGRSTDTGMKTIQDPRQKGQEIEVPKKGKEKTATITPVVTVINHGSVEVFIDQ